MNIFKRLFKIGEAEANAAIDNMEDPIKLTEQGIRDLRQDLDKNLEALAQVKALRIRANNDYEEMMAQSEEFNSKAFTILSKAKKGDISQEEGDRLATEALIFKAEKINRANDMLKERDNLQKSEDQLEGNVQKIKATINQWENELRTLKARVKVSKAKTSLNKQMAELDSSGTVAMLERMKEKIAQRESLADAYGEIVENSKEVKDEINAAADTVKEQAQEDLEALKKQLDNPKKK